LKDKIVEIGGKVEDVKENLKGKIISFLDKVEGKLLAGINSVNKAVQPVMLVKTSSSFQTLSQTIYSPTVMSSADVQFIPTSYTAEIVAPAYKKLVGVTDVFTKDRSKSAQNGDANCLSALKAANAKAGVAEILNGDTQLVNFTAKKGYIYEVTYTSVDFCGMVVAKKYYVTVK
jgi:HJR/Mrr/RecB family endonuclease